jgi:fructuronate reductase
MSAVARKPRHLRLSLATLDEPPALVRRPPFDPARLGVGIVHIGVGAFHRAHQAVYTEDAMAAAGGDWGILGVSLRRPDAAAKLVPQDCLYTVETLGEAAHYRVMGALQRVVTAHEQPQAVEAAIAADNVHIVTLTVTEKGYALTGEGALDLAHPDVAADLQGPAIPHSTIGWLMRGLTRRYHAGRRPLTVLSSDNVSQNGAKLRAALIRFAREDDPAVASWIEDEIGFPSTMVDCIVPATDAAALARVEEALGLFDAAAVQREEFSQWAIEDRFAGPRPAWEEAGAQFVDDVAPFEKLKLHVLNAAHSALAYLGPGRGHAYVRQAIGDAELAGFLDAMIAEEIAPALAPLPVADYWRQTKRRFANPRIDHALAQIAEDGSKKLALRIFPPLIATTRAGRPVRRLGQVVRAWLESARQPVRDPQAEGLARWAESGASVSAALDDPALFPEPFRAEPAVRAAVEHGR